MATTSRRRPNPIDPSEDRELHATRTEPIDLALLDAWNRGPTADALYEAFTNASTTERRAMIDRLPKYRSPNALERAYALLAAALDVGHVDAKEAWRLREAMRGEVWAAQWRARHRWNKPPVPWHPRPPETYRADVFLWLRIREHDPVFADSIGRQHLLSSPVESTLEGLIEVAGSADVALDEREALLGLASDLVRSQQRATRRWCRIDLDTTRRAIAALVPLAATPQASLLADSIATWLGRLQVVPESLDLLGMLVAHGCGGARRALLRLHRRMTAPNDGGVGVSPHLASSVTAQWLRPQKQPRFAKPPRIRKSPTPRRAEHPERDESDEIPF